MTEFLPTAPQGTALKPSAKTLPRPADVKEAEARHAAQQLEATFLAEMLKAAGFGEQTNSFSGGIGEEQFASFHRQAIADKLASTGGLGLAEHFFRSMMETRND